MKKIFFISALTFLFFFLFIPKSTFALESDYIPDLGNDIIDTEIICDTSDYQFCDRLGLSNSFYSLSSGKWYHNNAYSPISPVGHSDYNMFILDSNRFQGPQPDGKILLSDYYDSIYNTDYNFQDGYYSYSGFSDKYYRTYLVFVADGPVQTYTQIDNTPWTFELQSANGNDNFSTTEDFTDDYNVGFLNFDSSFVDSSGHSFPYGIILFFEFKSKLDFDKFKFFLSSEEYSNIYFGNASSDNDVRMTYVEFKFVETNKLLLDEDTALPDDIKSQIDKIYDSSDVISSQDSIFNDLKQCDITDIGCHFDNLTILVKGVFERIGEFFLSILDLFAWLLEKLSDLFNFLFVPDFENLSSTLTTFQSFIEKKLGFLFFPFDFSISFLERFVNMSDSVSKVITVPNITLGSFGTIIHGFSFNIAEYWEKPPFQQFYDIYLIFVHAFIGFGLYKLCLRKYNEIIGGVNS